MQDNNFQERVKIEQGQYVTQSENQQNMSHNLC